MFGASGVPPTRHTMAAPPAAPTQAVRSAQELRRARRVPRNVCLISCPVGHAERADSEPLASAHPCQNAGVAGQGRSSDDRRVRLVAGIKGGGDRPRSTRLQLDAIRSHTAGWNAMAPRFSSIKHLRPNRVSGLTGSHPQRSRRQFGLDPLQPDLTRRRWRVLQLRS